MTPSSNLKCNFSAAANPSGLLGPARPEEVGTHSGPQGLPGARSLGNRAGTAEPQPAQPGARAAEPQAAAGGAGRKRRPLLPGT